MRRRTYSRIDAGAVVLSGQAGDGTDGASSLAGHLAALRIALLRLLILEHDNLETNETSLRKKGQPTPSSGKETEAYHDGDGHTSDSNESQFPSVAQADYSTDEQCD